MWLENVLTKEESRLISKLIALGALIKVKQTLLLLLSMYIAYILGGGLGRPLLHHLTVLSIGFIAIASTTAINMYLDMDIDAVMERTKNRPLPRRIFNPKTTVALALIFLALSIVLGYILINAFYAAAITLGFFFDIVAYTILLKRKSPLSIIAGAIAGGMPSIGGWAAATSSIDSSALALSMIVVAWVPAHIWFLASYYRDDYARAHVPMLPVVGNELTVAMGIALASVFQAYGVMILAVNRVIGPISLVYGILLSVYVFKLSLGYATQSLDPTYAIKAFKRVNMGLALLYTSMILEKIALNTLF